MRSIFVGCLIAPLTAPLFFFLGIIVISVIHDGAAVGLHDWQAGVAAAAVFVLPVSYLATWIFGVPFFFWLRARARLTTKNVCFGAVTFGVISTWIFQWIGKAEPLQVEGLALGGLLGAGLALCVAIAFCGIIGTPLRRTV